MLKQLRLRAELKSLRNKLKDAMEQREKLSVRSGELAKALEEAETEEDIALIQEQVDEIEKELGDGEIDKSIDDLNAAIAEKEKELADIDAAANGGEGSADNGDNTQNEGGNREMIKGMTLRNMNYEQRAAFFAHSDVKEFCERVRSFKDQQRSVTNADLTIPVVMLDTLRQNIGEYSKLVGSVNLKKVKGKARQNVVGDVPEAIWTEATGVINELTFAFNQDEVDGYKVGGYVPISNSLLEDSDENLAGEIMDMLAKAIGYALDKAIVYGTGTKMPLGFVTRLAQTAAPSDYSAKARTWSDLHTSNVVKLSLASSAGATFYEKLINSLGVADSKKYGSDNLVWIMNRKTHINLMTKAIAFDSAAALRASADETMPVIGGKIVELDFMADNDIAGGYLGNYLLAERQGTTLGQSSDVKFIEDMTVFKGTARYDGKPIIAESFVIVNTANTAPTTAATFAADAANTVTQPANPSGSGDN